MSQTLDTTVSLLEGMSFRVETGSGHDLVLDASSTSGGDDRGPRPMEMLLAGLGGCTAMDVISMLRKRRLDVTEYTVRVHGDRATDHPMVFTRIEVEHVVRGRNIDPSWVHKAVELSATKYCSAAAMLGAVARIEETYRVIDVETGAEVAGSLAVSAAA